MVRQFARLKLRLVRNGLRSPQYAVLFTIGAAGAALLALVGFVLLAGQRGDVSAPDTTLVVFAAVTLAWTVVPLLGFGTDETLDPQRLALLPLRRGELLTGLLASSLTGVAPVATAVALTGAVVGLARDPLSALFVAAAVAATLLLCVVASRTLIALLAPLLRSRRGRDLLVMTVTLAAFVPQAFRLFSAETDAGNLRHEIAKIATRVRFTPFGLGGYAAAEAGRGHLLAAAGALGAVAALIGALLALWSIAIPWAMTSADLDASGRARRPRPRRSARFGMLPFLPWSRTGAVAAKELRYYVRDPRRRGPLFAALVVPTLFLFSTLTDQGNRAASSPLLALVALLPASGLTLNQFGLDGAALWSMVVTGNDPASDLRGKNLATAVVVAPLVTVPACVCAAVTGGWSYVPLTIGLAFGMLGVILAVGDVVSVQAPYALPDRKNPLAANPGQGCVGSIAATAALMVDALLLAPVGAVTGVTLVTQSLPVATVVSVPFALAYGGAAWRLGLRSAARRLWWRMPELLDAVSPRQAS
jgi:ABC-2 type transport system permease protein